MGETVQVTPEIEVPDSVLGFSHKTKLAFKIGDFDVFAQISEDGETTDYSVWIDGYYNEEESLYPPTAENAQLFLYQTILAGIFEEKALRVVFP